MLGIETSCDETSAAVVSETDGRWSIGSNIVASQVAIHREWGGIVPELASRQHIRDICGVVRAALDTATTDLAELDAIAVTQGPGLVGSLLVGVSFAKSLAVSLDRPLVPVHHLAGHIESLFLQHGDVAAASRGARRVRRAHEPLPRHGARRRTRASGGRAMMRPERRTTRSRSCLASAIPAGPIVDKRAREGNDEAVAFPLGAHDARRSQRAVASRGISISASAGLKTAVLRHVRQRTENGSPMTDRGDQRYLRQLSAGGRDDPARSPVRGGGAVRRAERRDCRRRVGERAPAERMSPRAARGSGCRLYVPHISLSTDNAAMIAAAGLGIFTPAGAQGWS